MSKQINRETHTIDATDRPLGRLASDIAILLIGKHKPEFEKHIDMGDNVIVKNISFMKLTGKKKDQKIYYRSTLFPGGIRETKAKQLIEEDPGKMLKMAVRLMLPDTKHRTGRLKRLTIQQ